MTITRAFAITFALALVCEAIGFTLDGEPSAGEVILFALGYALLIALGFMLAVEGRGYAIAFTSTWPFVLLWFLVGVFNLASSPSVTSPGSAQDQGGAFGGYVIATVMFLPLAFGASAFGVWLGRTVGRRGLSSAVLADRNKS